MHKIPSNLGCGGLTVYLDEYNGGAEESEMWWT